MNRRSSGFNLEDLKTTVSDYCKLSWLEVLKTYPSINSDYLINYCFGGAYIHTLLTEKYHLNPSSTHQFSVGDYSWTLGAMLHEAGYLHTKIPAEQAFLRSAGGVVLMIICCITLLTCLIVVFIGLYQFYVSSKRAFPTEKLSHP
jgi:hypothetical protein